MTGLVIDNKSVLFDVFDGNFNSSFMIEGENFMRLGLEDFANDVLDTAIVN